jgi:hypothetical protein
MITTRIFLYALPSSTWKKKTVWGNTPLDIGSFVEDALAIEERIVTGVNQENERARYTLCCNRLEAAVKTLSPMAVNSRDSFNAALQKSQVPIFSLSSHYLNVILLMFQKNTVQAANARMGSTFFPPERMASHIQSFTDLANELGISDQEDVKNRTLFYQIALNSQCGVIEIQVPFYFMKDIEAQDLSKISLAQGDKDTLPTEAGATQDETKYEDFEEEAVDNEGRNAFDILYEQVEIALTLAKEGKIGAVNFSNQPHNVITEVLNEFVFSDTGNAEKPVYIRVNYTDGSQGKPFPLLCLPNRAEETLHSLQESLPLRVAMLSIRHLAMDKDVDMAWFRNREVSKARAFGETDQFCYEFTKDLLEQSRFEGNLRLFLYQTGLQPAVIGFYRALTEELYFRSNDSPSLEVVPHFFKGKSGYRLGRPWN